MQFQEMTPLPCKFFHSIGQFGTYRVLRSLKLFHFFRQKLMKAAISTLFLIGGLFSNCLKHSRKIKFIKSASCIGTSHISYCVALKKNLIL